MGGLLRYSTPGSRHSQVPAMSPAGEAAAAHGPASAARNASLNTFMAVFSFISLSSALPDGYPLPVLGAGVHGPRTDDFTVDSLLDDVRRPARCARYHENRGEHRGGHAHHVIGDRTIPVQIGEHLLFPPHHLLDPFGDVEELRVPAGLREAPGDFLDHLVARIARCVDGVTEADDDLLVAQPSHDVGLGLAGTLVARQDFESELVRAAVLGAAQRADSPADRRVDVRSGAGDDAACEGRGVELVLRVEDE